MKDTLFQTPSENPFAFNKDVTQVFDNMIERSVPFYNELQSQLIDLCKEFIQPNTTIYDLGCSTGTTLKNLATALPNTKLIGIDYSHPMLEKAKQNCPTATLIHHDLNIPPTLKNPSIIILNLCLQFIQPENRPTLLHHLYTSLPKNGLLILIEKITPNHPKNAPLFETHDHAFKQKNGYSQDEIKNKKTALQNVLVPLTPNQNKTLLKEAGFENIETFFQWYSFIGIFAVK